MKDPVRYLDFPHATLKVINTVGTSQTRFSAIVLSYSIVKPLAKDDAIASTHLTTQSHSINSDELNLRCNPFEANTMLLDSTVAFAILAVAVSIILP